MNQIDDEVSQIIGKSEESPNMIYDDQYTNGLKKHDSQSAIHTSNQKHQSSVFEIQNQNQIKSMISQLKVEKNYQNIKVKSFG